MKFSEIDNKNSNRIPWCISDILQQTITCVHKRDNLGQNSFRWVSRNYNLTMLLPVNDGQFIAILWHYHFQILWIIVRTFQIFELRSVLQQIQLLLNIALSGKPPSFRAEQFFEWEVTTCSISQISCWEHTPQLANWSQS